MRTALTLLFLLGVSYTYGYQKEGQILLLDEITFEQAQQDFEFLMINFCADYIQSCIKFNPEFIKAASEFSSANRDIKFAKLDNSVNIELRDKYNAQRFPSLILFVRGSPSPLNYEGHNEANELADWINKKTGTPFIRISTPEEIEELIKDQSIVGLFFGDTDSLAYKTFVSIAKLHRDFTFAHVSDNELKQKYDVIGETFILFKQFDDDKNIFTGPFTLEDLNSFVKEHKNPIVIPYNHHSMKELPQKGLPMLLLLHSSNSTNSQTEQAFRAAAPKTTEKLFASIADIEQESGRDLIFRLGLNKDDLPVILILESRGKMEKFMFNGTATKENINEFVNKFLEKDLEPYLISESIPQDLYEDHVRVLVGKNFKEIVSDEENDVLVTFYTPECPDCEKFIPVYNKLAKKLSDVKGLIVAKINVEANELDNVSLRKFPTIRLYPIGQKKAHIDYLGETKEKDMLTFLEKHSKADIKVKQKLIDLDL